MVNSPPLRKEWKPKVSAAHKAALSSLWREVSWESLSLSFASKAEVSGSLPLWVAPCSRLMPLQR